ncbi:hypothetical protein CK203_104307 [Vitis vinifera]|uniref:V-type proton ATPase subunit S1/VOA1 transmembrane domain-containing protein n=1 Tax=Vitis vinifera TaxID=29760 RepID=A0A438EM56_VITVI|nr:hypothetical protein CK203_104307 [Vitis vinifera]
MVLLGKDLQSWPYRCPHRQHWLRPKSLGKKRSYYFGDLSDLKSVWNSDILTSHDFQGIVLLIILISGLCCMMGIDTPTRFEAPQDS